MSDRILPTLFAVLCLVGLSACNILSHQRVLYEDRGIRVGVEDDPTIPKTTAGSLNAHPGRLTPEELSVILDRLQVSGWTGMVAGLVVEPRPVPMFRKQELHLVVPAMVRAFQEARQSERVFFSIPDLAKPYRPERTEGALFLRGPYLYVMLTDHSAFTNTDTGGADEKDPRDTKGMKLSVARPLQPATPEPSVAPRWGPFEKVHLALDLQRSLGALSRIENQPAAARSSPAEDTSTNLELKKRLSEQADELRRLKEELGDLRRELENRKAEPRP